MSNRPLNHGPYRLSGYGRTYRVFLERFRKEGFVGADSINLNTLGNGIAVMFGEIACEGGIIIQVDKTLVAVGGDEDDPEIQTEDYSYNVSRHGHGNIFRYDNAAHHHRLHGHHDSHHKHVYDDFGEELATSPIWIGVNRWPHLSDVIEEAREWFYTNASRLALTHEFPPIRTWPS